MTKSVEEVLESISRTLEETDPRQGLFGRSDKKVVTGSQVHYWIDVDLTLLSTDTNAFYAVIYKVGSVIGIREPEEFTFMYMSELYKKYRLALDHCIVFSIGHSIYSNDRYQISTSGYMEVRYETDRYEIERMMFPDEFVDFLAFAFKDKVAVIRVTGHMHENKQNIFKYVSRKCENVKIVLKDY